MRGKYFKCKTPGIRLRKHATRKHGVKFDQYFYIRYRVDGRQREEGLGWSSEGWSESKAADLLSELKANQRKGDGPKTLKEKREIQLQKERALLKEKQKQDTQRELLERTILDNVFKEYLGANSHKKSLKDEINYYKNWIKPTLGKKRLDEIVLFDLERIKKKMQKAGKAARSTQYIKSIIRQIYNFASKRDIYTGPSPTTHFLENQKVDNNRQRYLSPDETIQLLEEVKKKSLSTYQISLLSLNSGMRFGEIASLEWQHIDTDNRTILVIDPKNSESRFTAMTDAVAGMFSGMEKGKPYDLVFPAKNGKRMDRISNTFPRAVDTLNLNEGITDRRMKVVFHTLRHTCASWLVNSGIEIPVIAKILGHKTLAMTMRYSHVNDKTVKDAMNMLDQKQLEQNKIVAINRT